jgi:hypothetical protein
MLITRRPNRTTQRCDTSSASGTWYLAVRFVPAYRAPHVGQSDRHLGSFVRHIDSNGPSNADTYWLLLVLPSVIAVISWAGKRVSTTWRIGIVVCIFSLCFASVCCYLGLLYSDIYMAYRIFRTRSSEHVVGGPSVGSPASISAHLRDAAGSWMRAVSFYVSAARSCC